MSQPTETISEHSILSGSLPENLQTRLAKNAISLWTLKHVLPYWAIHSSASRAAKWQEKNNQAVFNATFKPECKQTAAEYEAEDMDGLKMGDEQHNHYYPQPQQSAGSKLLGPLLIGASILGTGGIGTAGWVAVKAIEKIATMQQGKVEDGSMQIEFIGGEQSDSQSEKDEGR